MDWTSLLTFAAAILIATASPGPTVAALVARVLGRGAGGTPAFCAGLVLGDVVWFAAAVLGLSIVAQTAQPVFAAIKYAGAAYLLFLAYKLWTAPVEMPREHDPIRGEGAKLFAGGLALALGNPKTMLFYMALAPALVDMAHLDLVEFAAFQAVLITVYTGVLAAYTLLAQRARRFVQSARAVRTVNRATGGVMAGAAVLLATR
jgi:threonine/homoserine/homoserine lactone efflux protein